MDNMSPCKLLHPYYSHSVELSFNNRFAQTTVQSLVCRWIQDANSSESINNKLEYILFFNKLKNSSPFFFKLFLSCFAEVNFNL